ncbi:MAG: DUF3445 domain-containing protein [Planctomycetota bacterium]|nr:DUF3445 domain-containing protein [Planctomycetota bacterium]
MALPEPADPPPPPEFHPFKNAPFRMAMGLQELDPRDWIRIDERFAADRALKRELLDRRHAEVFAALPGSEAAGRECLELLAEHLLAVFPPWYRREDGGWRLMLSGERIRDDPALHPLDLAARLVQEDLCLMQSGPDGPYRLTAAAVCFPSRWKIAEKLGQPMRGIHAPVPFYGRELGEKADRFMEILAADRPVWRLNWNIHETPELFQPAGPGRTERDPSITPLNAGERLWLRVERQTLRRLPASRAILFTIRTYLTALTAFQNRPEVAAELAGALRGMPQDTLLYKSQTPWREAALSWLDSLSK